MEYARHHADVVFVSWVDSAEIAAVVEQISIQPVDRPLAQSVDSCDSSINRTLSPEEPRQWSRTSEQGEGGLRQNRAGHKIRSEEITQDHQRQSPPAHREVLKWR